MKFKSILFIVCALITTIVSAQNLTLAKAFYKKAQQEYSNKKYTQVFKLLDKTKENLGGETNPEITYLEAKTHYNNDINIAIAKKLMIQFLEEADSSDSRIDEISSLIVDIEVSDKIDKSGNFKDIAGRSGIKITYYDTGEKQWVQEFINGVKNGFIKRYNKKGTLIQSGTQKNGYVTGFYEWFHEDGKLWYTNYYDLYGKKNKEEKVYNKNGELMYVYTYSNGKKNGIYKRFFNGKLISEGNYENDKLKGKFTQYHTNGKISATYTYNNAPSYDTKTPSYIEGIKTSYYSNGIKSAAENYTKGKLQGTQKYYYDNGNLERWVNTNADGKYHGKCAEYYKSNGKRSIMIAYENGKYIELLEQVDVNGNKLKISKIKKGNGYIKKVNDTGVIIYEANIVNGDRDGKVKWYHDNGKLKWVTDFKDGKKIGKEKSYIEDGSLTSIYDFKSKKYSVSNYLENQIKLLNKLIEENKTIEEIIAFCKNKNQVGKDFYLAESAINTLGYELMTKTRGEDALKIFKLNIEFYPDAWNTYDSYGECLVKLGHKDEGMKAYEKSLELNPNNESAIKALKE